jgi:uncharacterized membrane protein (DUF485 family)
MEKPPMSANDSRALHSQRWRVALALTVGVIVIYFGFILLIAYRKEFMARLVTGGLTVGILLGALVIVLSWVLTWIYVRWANTHYDAKLRALQGSDR